MTPRLAYSLSEAAQALGLSVRSLRYLMQQGKLGYARIGWSGCYGGRA
jgi:DNA-binding transcriptional MerR regulator